MSRNSDNRTQLSQQFRAETERDLNAALRQGVDPNREYLRILLCLGMAAQSANSTREIVTLSADCEHERPIAPARPEVGAASQNSTRQRPMAECFDR